MGPHVVGFFDRVLLVGAVPSSESSFSIFFWIHNVMIQLCVSSIDSRDASAMSNHRRDVV
jgi:hypothetical protein